MKRTGPFRGGMPRALLYSPLRSLTVSRVGRIVPLASALAVVGIAIAIAQPTHARRSHSSPMVCSEPKATSPTSSG